MKQFCQQLKSIGKYVVIVMPSPVFLNMNMEIHGLGIEYVHWMQKRGIKVSAQNENDPLVLTENQYNKYYRDVIKTFTQWEEEEFCDVLHVEKAIFQYGNYVGYRDGILYCRDKVHITPAVSIEIFKHPEVEKEFCELLRK